jgi:hypothetical protein
VAGEVVGQVAVELQQEAEQAVAYFALCECAGGSGLIVYPALWQGLVDIFLVQESTYRCTANVRYSVSCGIFCGIAQQNVCFGVVLALI